MGPIAVVLVLISAVFHACWNIMIRGQKSKTAFVAGMLASVALIGFIPAVIGEAVARSMPPQVWLFVSLSGLCCGSYFYSLSRAYSASDFTIVYPVARALPVLVIGMGDVIRGRFITPGGWLGLALVTVGCIFAPLHSFREIKLHRYINRGNFWVVIAAAGTVGFTMFDKLSSELVKPGPTSAARYGYFLYLFSFITFLILMKAAGGDHRENSGIRINRPAAIAGGFFSCGGYCLILWAFQFSSHASYVHTFRQISIVIGVIVAFAVYREKGLAVRLTGTLMITSGLVVLKLLG